MASEAARAWWKDPKMLLTATWIFGCAAYFYVRFTWHFVDQHEHALRDLGSRLADTLALPGRER